MRRFLAKLLYPRAIEDQENYLRLITAIHEAAAGMGYTFPTVRACCSWLLAHVNRTLPPDLADLHRELIATVGSDEADELCGRLSAALSSYDKTIRH